MATVKQLQRRISELERELESLRHQRTTFQSDFTKMMNERTEHLKKEYEVALKRQKDETEEMYARRLMQFQEQMAQETNQRYQKLQKETERIVNEQGKRIEELSACNDELCELLKKMKANTQETATIHKSVAEELLEQVKQTKEAVEQSPHEFFFQGEFEIIDSHAVQISDEIEKEMFQAAVSDANSVIMEFDLLNVKVEQALHEWMLAFEDYRRIVRELETRVSSLETCKLQTVVGTFQMKEIELNFWSCGTYLCFKQKLKGALTEIEEIERLGIVFYLKTLKQRNTVNRKAIFTQVYEAQKWNDELSGIINCIYNERMFSDERWQWAQIVEKQLSLIGYHKHKKGFQEVEPRIKALEWYPKARKYWQNPLDSFELVETIQGMDFLFITFIPVREHGVSIRNECIVSFVANTLKDCDLINEIMKVNIDRIRSAVGDIKIIGIDSQDRKTQEEQRKKEPNPIEQIRYLERKYH